MSSTFRTDRHLNGARKSKSKPGKVFHFGLLKQIGGNDEANPRPFRGVLSIREPSRSTCKEAPPGEGNGRCVTKNDMYRSIGIREDDREMEYSCLRKRLMAR